MESCRQLLQGIIIMSIDAIQGAINTTKNKALNLPTIPTAGAQNQRDATEAARAAAQNQLDAAQAAAQQKVDEANARLEELAKYKDPEFIKKEAKALALVYLANKQAEILARNAEIIAKASLAISLLTMLYLAYPIKLPPINPKALAKKAYQKTKKELRELKQNLSKTSLKSGKETFKYPMKPSRLQAPQIPDIPELPRIPQVPQIPNVSIPKIP